LRHSAIYQNKLKLIKWGGRINFFFKHKGKLLLHMRLQNGILYI
jgi:hypothetical protein